MHALVLLLHKVAHKPRPDYSSQCSMRWFWRLLLFLSIGCSESMHWRTLVVQVILEMEFDETDNPFNSLIRFNALLDDSDRQNSKPSDLFRCNHNKLV